jgi:hypothetical protein
MSQSTYLRTYGRTYDEEGNSTWVEVTTDSNGFNDAVYLTAIAQVIKLNLNESPFWANWGIPQIQTIVTQVFPDYYMTQIQQQFAQYFASLTITRVANTSPPAYSVVAVTHSGAILSATVPT